MGREEKPMRGPRPELLEFAGRLAAVRRIAGLTQAEFAETLEIKVPTYIQYERGITELPAKYYFVLSDNFAVDPTWLGTGKGTMRGHVAVQALDDDQAEAIASRVYRRLGERMDSLDGKFEALKAAACEGASRAIASAAEKAHQSDAAQARPQCS